MHVSRDSMTQSEGAKIDIFRTASQSLAPGAEVKNSIPYASKPARKERLR
jgi:hypothetical protein